MCEIRLWLTCQTDDEPFVLKGVSIEDAARLQNEILKSYDSSPEVMVLRTSTGESLVRVGLVAFAKFYPLDKPHKS